MLGSRRTTVVEASQRALALAGLTIDDMDVVEINEAFAPVVRGWLDDHASRTGAHG